MISYNNATKNMSLNPGNFNNDIFANKFHHAIKFCEKKMNYKKKTKLELMADFYY